MKKTTLLLAILLFPLLGMAQTTEGKWTYIVKEGGVIITFSTATGAVTIPNTLGGLPVIGVSGSGSNYYGIHDIKSAFYRALVTSVTIPDSVTSIGDYAFYGCTDLTSVTIPNSVTSIGSSAFYGCTGLTSVTIPNSVWRISDYTFYGCSGLTSITIPDSVTSIGDYAFYGWRGLTSVTIPDSVRSIGEGAFYGCTDLTSVTIPNSVTSIGGGAFGSCTRLTSFSMPDRFLTDIEYIGLAGQVATNTLIQGIAKNLGSNNGFITNFTNSVLSKNDNYGLSTKADLTSAMAPLATKADLTSATAPLATKSELSSGLAPLATKTELASSLEALSTDPKFVAALVNNPAFMAALAKQIASEPNNFGISIKQNQTLTFKAITAQVYAANKTINLSATSSAKLTPITYVSSNPAVATVKGNVVKLIGKGTTTITATQAGNSEYNPASKSQKLLVK